MHHILAAHLLLTATPPVVNIGITYVSADPDATFKYIDDIETYIDEIAVDLCPVLYPKQTRQCQKYTRTVALISLTPRAVKCRIDNPEPDAVYRGCYVPKERIIRLTTKDPSILRYLVYHEFLHHLHWEFDEYDPEHDGNDRHWGMLKGLARRAKLRDAKKQLSDSLKKQLNIP